MHVSQALSERRSVRAFLPEVPSAALVQSLLEQAAQAASGGNLQPWRALALIGQPLAEALRLAASSEADQGGAQSYPSNLWEPYRTRRFANGEDLYRSLGIERADKSGRLRQFAKNKEFFGAPVGVFICVDERMGSAQWMDLGIYLQSLMLLAVQHGLGTCAQGFWRNYDAVLRPLLGQPPSYCVALGVALGYEDCDAPINQMRSTRAPWGEWGELRGFD